MIRRLLLVRHCESSGQAPDAPLTARGLEQAEALADRLAPLAPDAAVSSPYLRAQQTVAPLAARLRAPLVIEPRLAERRLGEHGRDDWRAAVAASFDDLDLAFAGGESGRAVQARARDAVAEVLARGHRLPVLATHGNLLALLLTSIDGHFGFRGWERLENPDVFVLHAAPGGWSYTRWIGGALDVR